LSYLFIYSLDALLISGSVKQLGFSDKMLAYAMG